jgi:mRNA interferase MazF
MVTTVAQGELILIPFPFSDLSGQKIRPAVVISRDSYNLFSNDFWCIPVTSANHAHKYAISITPINVVGGKLFRASNLRYD